MTDRLVDAYPTDQLAVDLFEGTWATALPLDGLTSGTGLFFDDPRVDWLLAGIGPLDGMEALELGPLEGGHTAMLLRAGAARVLAIEANRDAFLRCLVTKNLLDLAGAKFLLGDFDAYLAARPRRFDLILCSGVLYHLQDPLRTLQNMAAMTDRVCIWSHFFFGEAVAREAGTKPSFTGRRWLHREGDDALTYHEHVYGESQGDELFRGGVRPSSAWIALDEAVSFFERMGFSVEVGLAEVSAFGHACLRAVRRDGAAQA